MSATGPVILSLNIFMFLVWFPRWTSIISIEVIIQLALIVGRSVLTRFVNNIYITFMIHRAKSKQFRWISRVYRGLFVDYEEHMCMIQFTENRSQVTASGKILLQESMVDHLSSRTLPATMNIFFQWLFQPIEGPGLLFSSVIIFSQTVWILGRVISPSQGRYLNTE
jgi:hypothetical protein